jgi:hypothetical protein
VTITVWVILALLILANTFYVAAEFAAVGVRRSRIRRMAEDGNGLARRMLPFVQHPAELDRYVAVSQVGITLSSLIPWSGRPGHCGGGPGALHGHAARARRTYRGKRGRDHRPDCADRDAGAGR